MEVDKPRNRPANAILEKKFFFSKIIFTEKYRNNVKKNRNIVSDNTCDDKIIINGDNTADKYINNFCLGNIRLPILYIIKQFIESNTD